MFESTDAFDAALNPFDPTAFEVPNPDQTIRGFNTWAPVDMNFEPGNAGAYNQFVLDVAKMQPKSETMNQMEGVFDARFGGTNTINAYLINFGEATGDYP